MIISQIKQNAAFAKVMEKMLMQFSVDALKKFTVSQLRGIETHWKMVTYEGQYWKIGGILG